jgi:iron complex transport system substrate-binding protein
MMFGAISASVGAAFVASLPNAILAQEASPAAGVVTDTFPVAISHVYGETVIDSAPERVVTIGWSTQDAVIALGVDPVGMPINAWGGDADGFLPWTRAALGDRELPTMLDTTELPYEVIAGLNPDVILAPYSGITEDEYGLLSAIAPTVAYPEVAWGTSWQDVQTITGQALGMSAEAEQLVADTEGLIASQLEQYPALAGKTFIYGNMGDGTTGFNIYTSTDSRSLFLAGIGLEPAPFVLELDEQVDPAVQYFVPVSYEEAASLEADIVVFWFGTQEEYDAALEVPTFSAIPAVARGSFAPIIGQDLVMATSAFSTLSIPYMLDAFMPILGEAAANTE